MADFKLDWVVVRSAVPAAAQKPVDIGHEIAGPSAVPRGAVLAGAGRTSGRPAARDISIAKERMSFRETGEMLGQAGTIAAAPILPMTLIEPRASVAAAAPTVSWNVARSGADRSRFDGAGVTVAVLDTGIDAAHPAFEGVAITQKNFTGAEDHDTHGHGTHCAGTIFGRDVAGSRIGIARGVGTALIAKVLGSDGGSTETIVRAVQWAQAMGADVISMSLGMDFTDYQQRLVARGLPQKQATALTLEGFRLNILMFAALAKAIGGQAGLVDGSVVVAAAGNSSDAPNYTIATEPPANSEGFVSVAALDVPVGDAPRLAPFSNVGAKLAAGGVDVWSASPGGGLVAMSGTSMATPTVAGLACLWEQKMKQNRANAGAQDVVAALREHARPLVPVISDKDVAWGEVQAPLG